MRVLVSTSIAAPTTTETAATTNDMTDPSTINGKIVSTATTESSTETPGVEYVNMASGLVVTILGWLIWTFITGLNIYLIVMLALGKR